MADLLSKNLLLQIPVQNMILRGTEQDYHEGTIYASLGQFQGNKNAQYFSHNNEKSIFDKEFESLKKIIAS